MEAITDKETGSPSGLDTSPTERLQSEQLVPQGQEVPGSFFSRVPLEHPPGEAQLVGLF